MLLGSGVEKDSCDSWQTKGGCPMPEDRGPLKTTRAASHDPWPEVGGGPLGVRRFAMTNCLLVDVSPLLL